jgi:hypothetical protein
MDRRQYPRTNAAIPIAFQVRRLAAPGTAWLGRGWLTNLSLTGIYFVPNDRPPLKPGDIGEFTFTPDQSHGHTTKSFLIKARGKVMRIARGEDQAPFGIAVAFLSGPYFG